MFSRIIGLLLLIAAYSIMPIMVIGQTPSPQNLREKLFDLEFRKLDFHSALGSLAKKHKIPIGLHATENPEPAGCLEEFDLSFKNKTIDYIMNSLVSKCPIYSWSIDGEVVNVEPAAAEPFLTDIQISSLEIKDMDISGIVDAIFETNELRQALKSDGLGREDSRPIGFRGNPRKYNLDFKNYSVKCILNELIRSTDNRMWVFFKFKFRSENLVSLNVF